MLKEFIGDGDMQGDRLLCIACNTSTGGPLNNQDGSVQRCPNCYIRVFCHGGVAYPTRREMNEMRLKEYEDTDER